MLGVLGDVFGGKYRSELARSVQRVGVDCCGSTVSDTLQWCGARPGRSVHTQRTHTLAPFPPVPPQGGTLASLHMERGSRERVQTRRTLRRGMLECRTKVEHTVNTQL